MRADFASYWRGLVAPLPRLNVWQWAAANVDYGREPAYDSPASGPYDPDWVPFWKEPAENLFNPAVRETWILKPSRAACSENVALNPIRYCVAVAPRQVLYMSGDQNKAESFLKRRIKRGFALSEATARKHAQSRATEYAIDFPDMTLAIGWPASRMAFRQDGYELIILDEWSGAPEAVADAARKRAATYRYAHICGMSSLDHQKRRPTDDDPMYVEYMAGDRRKWMMPDPETGSLFEYVLGDRGGAGLKWDAGAKRSDGTWDYKAVRRSAHYITPDGTRIDEADRLRLVALGQWVATNPHGAERVRSYQINDFYMPFPTGEFGDIAVGFLRAHARGRRDLRVFFYERLAEPFWDTKETAPDDAVTQAQGGYQRGSRLDNEQTAPYGGVYVGKPSTVFCTADVQKGHLWAVCRQWFDGGDSGLLEWRILADFGELDSFANQHAAQWVYPDVGYAGRAMEVYEYAMRSGGVVPCRGSDRLTLPYIWDTVDPYEGKRGQGETALRELRFNADVLRCMTMALINGEDPHVWGVYQGIEREYIQQVTAEERIDGKWQVKRGRTGNHLWDCEVMQTLAAMANGVLRSAWTMTDSQA